MAVHESHEVLAERLRSRVRDAGSASQRDRVAAFALGSGREAAATHPVAELARMVGSASYRVTDAMVDRVRSELGSEVAAFEVVMSASIGAGLVRWDATCRMIEEAAGEAS